MALPDKRRKVKFKDGTTGFFTPAEKPQLTMYSCINGTDCVGGEEISGEIKPKQLNTTEYIHGQICTACLVADKTRQSKKEINILRTMKNANEKLMNRDIMQLTGFVPDILPLEDKEVNYIGIIYRVEIYNVKGTKEPHIKITDPEGICVHQSGTSNETKLGREIFIYCRNTKDEKGVTFIPINSI